MAESTINSREPSISVRRIKEISFFIDEPLIAKRLNGKEGLINFQIGLQLSFTADVNVVFLLSRIFCHLNDSPDEILSEIQVQNIFEIAELKRFQTGPAELVLPEQLIMSMVGVSISHARALMAKNIIGTPLQENNLGLVNSYELARHFFPQMFALHTPVEQP